MIAYFFQVQILYHVLFRKVDHPIDFNDLPIGKSRGNSHRSSAQKVAVS